MHTCINVLGWGWEGWVDGGGWEVGVGRWGLGGGGGGEVMGVTFSS